MPGFSRRSKERLKECDGRLQLLFYNVVEKYDCTIITGRRTKDEQDKAYSRKRSKLKFPMSKHNQEPSAAIDVAPWVKLKDGSHGISWEDNERFRHFAGYVLGTGHTLGINLRWGGDWDGDMDYHDNGFNDLVHFELN